jgi:phage tail sheath protein FI
MADLNTFFHGVETEYKRQAVSVQSLPTNIVAYVGTAPVHRVQATAAALNDLTIVNSDSRALELFGPDVNGYTLPDVLDCHFGEGGGIAYVVNVFDPAVHREAVDVTVTFGASNIADLVALGVQSNDASRTYVNGADWTYSAKTGRLARAPRGAIPKTGTVTLTGFLGGTKTVSFAGGDIIGIGTADLISATVTNAAGTSTYTAGTDYTLDALTGRLVRKPTGAIPALGTVKVAGWRGAPHLVTAADIIGEVGEVESATGLHAFAHAFDLLGANPRAIAAPGWTTVSAVRTEIDQLCTKIRDLGFIDMPGDLTVQEAIEARGANGLADYQTDSVNLLLHYPYLAKPDALGGDRLIPYTFAAPGHWAAVIAAEGINSSASNRPFRTVKRPSRPIRYGKSGDDANLLNAAGIITTRSSFGQSLRPWGNWSAAWPTERDPIHFYAQLHANNVADEAIELLLLGYLGKRLTPALIESILGVITDYYGGFVGQGIMLDFKVSFPQSLNPPAQLDEGIIVLQEERGWAPPLTRVVRQTQYSRTGTSTLYQAAA